MKRLEGIVQHYAWGDTESIPALLGQPADDRPWAELWFGAHHGGPSTIDGRSLSDVIAEDPQANLGERVAAEYGELPFLLKILAAAKPLSIQAHPSRQQAQAGFALEEQSGIDRADPARVYRDGNHKPELICALTPFHAKCGFRELDATRRLFALLAAPALEPLATVLNGTEGGPAVLARALAYLLRLHTEERVDLVRATVSAAQDASSDEFQDDLHWVGAMNAEFADDIGVVVALLLNHVTLQPGEAVFLPAGNLHSYLSGLAVEAMANSDNVLRGGCTPKHIAIDELLAVVDTTPMEPSVQPCTGPAHRYAIEAPDFSLTRHDVAAESVTEALTSAEIVLVTEGEVTIAAGGEQVTLRPGQAAYLPHADGDVRLEGSGVAFRAGIGAA